jgi:hypothetical protein
VASHDSRPWKTSDFDGAIVFAASFSVSPHHATSGFGKHHRGHGMGRIGNIVSSDDFSRDTPFVGGLVSHLGLPGQIAMAKLDGSCGAALLVDNEKSVIIDLVLSCS